MRGGERERTNSEWDPHMEGQEGEETHFEPRAAMYWIAEVVDVD